MNKYSLCIGNNNYSQLDKLDNAINDAVEVGKKLEELGFVNQNYQDLSSSEIGLITDFVGTIEENKIDVILIYYAGHGIEIDGNNYLLPIDFQKNGSKGIKTRMGYGLNDLVGELSKYDETIKIIILDACRNEIGRGCNGSGFAPIYAPKNTIIAFSTSPNQRARENSATGHGAYTSVLLKKIGTPFLSIEEMLKEVRKEVIESTSGEQVPWEHTSLVQNFYFNRESLYSSISYSTEALKDREFVFESQESIIKGIVGTLKSYNFYTQNQAFSTIYSLDPDYEYSINELFVLGRNILQAAEGNSWRAQEFIRDFNSWDFPLKIKHHVLNGIAYEMYFDALNRIRSHYKNSFLEEVIKLLENEQYSESRQFIAGSLIRYNKRVLYIPGQKTIMRLVLNTHKQDEIFVVDEIYYNGVLVSDLSKAEIIDRTRRFAFKSILSKRLMCPIVSLVISGDIPTDDDSIIEYEPAPYFEII